jgi:hypothetical protein
MWRLYRPLGGLFPVTTAIDEMSGVLSMHVSPPAIRIVVVPARVTFLLGLRYPPRSWTNTVSPYLPSFTIAPMWPKSIVQDSPEV